MLPEMKVYESQINLKLLNSIVWFVTSTANATVQQTKEISSQHILLTEPDSVNTFQQDYGFLYLGELLERYEERYGMALPDLRAIALALGYTRNIATPDMFIGNQRSLFLQTVRQKASGDVYLLGALYLLEEGQSGAVPLAEELSALCGGSLETLLFAMSVFPDFSATFLRFKPQLLHLLSDQRTISVLENTWLYNWLVTKLSPLLKTIRTKDMALFRALCSLPLSRIHIRHEDKQKKRECPLYQIMAFTSVNRGHSR